MNTLQMAARLAPQASRALTTSARLGSVSMKQSYETANNKGVVPSLEGYQKVRTLQNEFNDSPDKMVWQKRGLRDSAPLQVTAVLCLGGLGLAFYQLWDMSFPKPPQ